MRYTYLSLSFDCEVSLTRIEVEPLADWWSMAELDAYAERLRDLHADSTA